MPVFYVGDSVETMMMTTAWSQCGGAAAATRAVPAGVTQVTRRTHAAMQTRMTTTTTGSRAVLEATTVTAVETPTIVTAVETPTTIVTMTVTESVAVVVAQLTASEAEVAEETGTASATVNVTVIATASEEEATATVAAIVTLIELIVIAIEGAWTATRPPRADPTPVVTGVAAHRGTRTTTLTVVAEARISMLRQRNRRSLHRSALGTSSQRYDVVTSLNL